MAIHKKRRELIRNKATKIVQKELVAIRRHNHLRPKVRLKVTRSDQMLSRKGRPPKVLPSIRYSEEFKQIVDYFINPLIKEMSHSSKEDAVLELLSVKYRDIVLAVADVSFTMTGMVWDTTSTDQRMPTIVESKIHQGTTLLVRLDERMPERIDIERPDKNIIFSLTNSEYSLIYKYIKEVTGCDIRLEPPQAINTRGYWD